MAKKVESNVSVTVVRFNQYKPSKNNKNTNLLGFATVNVNGVVISGIRLLDGRNGHFIGMPSEKNGDDYYNTVWFDFGSKQENAKVYDKILEEVDAEYSE